MPGKPKITLDVKELPSGAVAVSYTFDFGKNGTLNFSRGTSNEEIQRYMKEFYDRQKALHESVKPDRTKIPNTIDW